jgi:hypothetical protein
LPDVHSISSSTVLGLVILTMNRFIQNKTKKAGIPINIGFQSLENISAENRINLNTGCGSYWYEPLMVCLSGFLVNIRTQN